VLLKKCLLKHNDAADEGDP